MAITIATGQAIYHHPLDSALTEETVKGVASGLTGTRWAGGGHGGFESSV